MGDAARRFERAGRRGGTGGRPRGRRLHQRPHPRSRRTHAGLARRLSSAGEVASAWRACIAFSTRLGIRKPTCPSCWWREPRARARWRSRSRRDCGPPVISTGLHVTPYLQTPLEKFWLDGRLARPGELAVLADVDPPGRSNGPTRGQPPTYGMVWVALTFEYFRRARVDALGPRGGRGRTIRSHQRLRPAAQRDHHRRDGSREEPGTLRWPTSPGTRPASPEPGVPTVIGDMPVAGAGGGD